jgi:uncharacterized membrane protein
MSSERKKHYNLAMLFLVLTSIFGLLLSLFFVTYPPILEDDWGFRDLAVGSAFCAICILGIFAAIFPGSCSATPDFGKRNRNEKSYLLIHEKDLRAHHPSCDNYSTHILRVGKREFCATCTGLLVGALTAMVGAITYFSGSVQVGETRVLGIIGAAAVIVGFLQSAMPKSSNSITRFFASVSFVVGCFLVLVSLDEAVKSITIDLFFLALSILWIITKIAFSQSDHYETCSQCSTGSCGKKRKRVR